MADALTEPRKRFYQWTFCDQLLTARSDSGEEVRFTRQERALLALFVASPQTLLNRERLLFALPRNSQEGGDRHVDFLVNRIRRRLGDTARDPRFIATQYGEGYVWIAPPQQPIAADTYLVFVPLHRALPTPAQALATVLCEALGMRLQHPHRAAIAPAGWQPAFEGRHAYLIEISAYADASTLHMALLLRDARTRQAIHPLRITQALAPATRDPVTQSESGGGMHLNGINALADTLHQHLWAHQALAAGPATPTEQPLELRLHEATRTFGEQSATWRESLAYLGQLGDQRLDAPLRDLSLASAHMTRIVQQMPTAQWLTTEEWDGLERDIERLVLPHLPAIDGQPLLQLAAARLLKMTYPRHFEQAFALARNGFAGTTAFATGFATLAQFHAADGDFATAHELYERSIELAEPGSEFHVYLLVLQCIAYAGSGDLAGLAQCRNALFAAKPATRQEFGLLLYGPEGQLPADLAALLPMLGDDTLRHLLYALHRSTGYRFRHAKHQALLLRGLTSCLIDRINPACIPPAMRALLARPDPSAC